VRGSASLVILGAGAVAVWAGRLGAAGRLSEFTTYMVSMVAGLILIVVVPKLVAEDFDWLANCFFLSTLAVAVLLPLPMLTAGLTAAELEVRHGRWSVVTVQEERCEPHDSAACIRQFRVTDPVTEHDFGWIACDRGTYRPGDPARLRVDPGRRYTPKLEDCARTDPLWTTAWLAALSVYVAAAAAVLLVAILRARSGS